jgi:hypothetical protein
MLLASVGYTMSAKPVIAAGLLIVVWLWHVNRRLFPDFDGRGLRSS